MKILYIHQHFATPRGSSGIRSYQMARNLIARGHEVTMVCGQHRHGATGLTGDVKHGQRTGLVDGIEVIELNLPYSNKSGFISRTWTFMRFAFHSVWLALSREYDIIVATSTPLTVGLAGIAGRWLRRKPFIFEVRDLWPELPKAMGAIRNPFVLTLLSTLEWMCYHSADRLIALSPGIRQGILKQGIRPEIVSTIPNGCDNSIFEKTGEPWRPEKIDPHDLLAVFSGTHGLANGLDAVLDVASELKARGRNDIKLLLIGDGMMKPRLEKRAKEEQLTNVFFHDPVDKKRLAALFESADIGLQTLANVPAFYFGTSPNKFFDYISAGLPVLNNYPGWLAEMIEENQSGFWVAPESPEAFADALIAAANDRVELAKMGDNAKSLARRHFDRQKLADEWAEIVDLTAKRIS